MLGRLLLVILLSLGFIACATTGSNQSQSPRSARLQDKISDLEKQIQEKESQIRDLETQLAKTKEPEVLSKEEEMVDLSKATPEQIQTALKKAGFYSGEVDGKVGRKTKEAVKEFQKANGLKADGKVGKQTWSKLQKYLE